MSTTGLLPQKEEEVMFSKDDFFKRVRELYKYFEVTFEEKEDELLIFTQSLPWKFCFHDDDGKWGEHWFKMHISIYAIYRPYLCSYGVDVTGHNQFFGHSHPVKTLVDLNSLEAVYIDKLPPKQSEYGEQGNLFEDLFAMGFVEP